MEIGILAGIVTLSAFAFYIKDAVGGKSRPNRATWAIWTVLALVITASYYAAGARDTIFAAAAFTLGQASVALVSIRYGTGGWSIFDRLCLGGAFLGIILWFASGSALLALVFAICVDFLGAMPTIKKLLEEPGSESRAAWTVFSLGNLLNVLAIESWTMEIALFPLYFLVVNGIVLALSLRRK
ncbi:MAG TPA: hypothetical protein VLD37_02625 [Candidatus Bilamarchaeum sp.]|nr:hypothetical protein [Candidatus Bilamarchaeum sp.]